jgi:hypothetical protein
LFQRTSILSYAIAVACAVTNRLKFPSVGSRDALYPIRENQASISKCSTAIGAAPICITKGCQRHEVCSSPVWANCEELSTSICFPLCPRTRTLLDAVGVSQRCYMFDHLVGTGEQRRRNRFPLRAEWPRPCARRGHAAEKRDELTSSQCPPPSRIEKGNTPCLAGRLLSANLRGPDHGTGQKQKDVPPPHRK